MPLLLHATSADSRDVHATCTSLESAEVYLVWKIYTIIHALSVMYNNNRQITGRVHVITSGTHIYVQLTFKNFIKTKYHSSGSRECLHLRNKLVCVYILFTYSVTVHLYVYTLILHYRQCTVYTGTVRHHYTLTARDGTYIFQ